MSQALGVTDLPSALWDLGRRLGAPASLAELGFRADQVDEAARLVAAGGLANPRPVTAGGVRAVLMAALDGGRPRPERVP
jgi:alcohol dehydrogenase class IV